MGIALCSLATSFSRTVIAQAACIEIGKQMISTEVVFELLSLQCSADFEFQQVYQCNIHPVFQMYVICKECVLVCGSNIGFLTPTLLHSYFWLQHQS